MKIGLMHNLYGAYSRGGAETVVKMMAADFKKAGQEVFLITTKPREKSAALPAETPVAADDLKIYYLDSAFYNLADLPKTQRLAWHINNIFSFKKYRLIKKILQVEKPDLVITHNLVGLGFLAPAALHKLGIRHEHFLHDIQLIHPSGLMIWGEEKKIDSFGAKIYQALTRFLFSQAAKVISPSAWLLQLHEQRGFFQKAAKEVRPFIWPQAIVPHSKLTTGFKKFLFIGQIEQQKGVFLLIEAFKKLPNPDISLTFAIRSGGQSLAAAQQAALGDKRIKFLGPLSYEETETIKAASDCLVVPSLCYENSPTTIYGARASGLPVIAAAIGGIPEIIGSENKLFQPGNIDDLRKKMGECL